MAEDILSFAFKIEDSKTDFSFESSVDMDTGNFCLAVSDYLPNLAQYKFEADSSEALDAAASAIAIELFNLSSGLHRVERLMKTIVREGKELQIDSSFEIVTSTYRATLGGKEIFTKDPNVMADAIEKYIKECKRTQLDELNSRLHNYHAAPVTFGENYSWYKDGVFLSIYYRTRANFVISFHPSIDVDQWMQFECTSLREFNMAIEKILRRLS